MPTDGELGQAISRLRAHGGYRWLLDGQEVWFASDIAKRLTDMGIPVTSNAVTAWMRDYPSAQDFGRLGRSISREDAIRMLAARFTKKAANE